MPRPDRPGSTAHDRATLFRNRPFRQSTGAAAPASRCECGSPQDGAHARQQLAHVEWLGKVVVGADLIADDPVEHAVERRHHHDRHRPRSAQPPGDRQTILLRHRDVEEHEIGRARARAPRRARRRRSMTPPCSRRGGGSRRRGRRSPVRHRRPAGGRLRYRRCGYGLCAIGRDMLCLDLTVSF